MNLGLFCEFIGTAACLYFITQDLVYTPGLLLAIATVVLGWWFVTDYMRSARSGVPPVYVTSGYRSKEENDSRVGQEASNHYPGFSIDPRAYATLMQDYTQDVSSATLQEEDDMLQGQGKTHNP